MNAIQNTGNSPIMSMKVPTQNQLNQWVDEALALFIAEHAAGRKFTAWEVCLHLIATYGGEYAIPHADRGSFIGVRSLVYSKMDTLKDDPAKLYERETGVAPDGAETTYWIPQQPAPQLVSINTVDQNNSAGAATPSLSAITYQIGKFVFND